MTFNSKVWNSVPYSSLLRVCIQSGLSSTRIVFLSREFKEESGAEMR